MWNIFIAIQPYVKVLTVMLWYSEVHGFHEHDEYSETFDNLEKQSIIVNTSSVLIGDISFVNAYLVISPCKFIQASISAYNSQAPPIHILYI